MTRQATDVLSAVLRAMAGDPGLVDEVAGAARAAAPEVARLPEAENRRHIVVMLAAAITVAKHLVGQSGEPEDDVYAAAEALGADRAAQGIPIEALLRGVHAGRTRAVEIAVGRGQAAGVSSEAMLDALVRFNRYAGDLERHVISGHRRAELAARDAHTHVLRRLLHGPGELSDDEITRAGLRADGRYHCVLSDVFDPVRARTLEQRLAGLGGLYGLVEGRLAGLAPRTPVLDEPADVLVVVAPAASLRDVRARYHLCLTAIAAAGGRCGVHQLTDLAGETALTAQPVLADLLAEEYLAALHRADPFHRQLAGTGLAYLDHGQRVDQTAEALHVHPNTVRYRLAKLTELTGADPADPPTVLHTLRWWWALHTWLNANN